VNPASDLIQNRVRSYLALLIVVYCLVTVFSLVFSLQKAVEESETLALSTARSFFQQVVVTRRWNAVHGGVYVPISEHAFPNEYLEDPRRDVVTTQGLKLTKLNPAYMTRLISVEAQKDTGTRFHMTSVRPLRPENAPDEWERKALESFEQGITERAEVIGSGPTSVYRYIAPLKTEASCLACHAKQGYKLNDIRGGIGLTFSYQVYHDSIVQKRRATLFSHLLFFFFGLSFLLVLGYLLLKRIRELQAAQQHIHKLEGLLPICANCKKIRKAGTNSKAPSSWEPIESYIQHRSDAKFTHGVCPECAHKLYPKE